MKVYENVKTKVQGLFLREENGKSVLLIDGKEKAYSQSTMKRWWREVEQQAQPVEENVEVVEPVEEVAPVEETVEPVQEVVEPEVKENVEPVQNVKAQQANLLDEIFANVQKGQSGSSIAYHILATANDLDCKFNITSSYIGVKVGKKTIMEVHVSKRGKVKIVVNSKSLPDGLIKDLEKTGRCKKAPESYGWTLDYTIQCNGVIDVELQSLIDEVIRFGVVFRS